MKPEASEMLRARITRLIKNHGVRGIIRGVSAQVRLIRRARLLSKEASKREAIYQARLKKGPIGDDGLIEIPVNDYRMKVPAADTGLARDLIIDGIREEGATHMMNRLLNRKMTVLEIGANLGYYVLLEAMLLPEGSEIFAFEPHPSNVATLRKNLAINETMCNVGIFQMALSDKVGTAKLIVEGVSNHHHLGSSETGNGGRQHIEVATTTVDRFCAERGIKNVDLMRMDVEGHEVEIIAGAERILTQSDNPIVFLEIHTSLIRKRGLDPLDLLRQMERVGLNIFAFTGHRGTPNRIEPLSWGYLYDNLPFLLADHGAHIFLARDPRALS